MAIKFQDLKAKISTTGKVAGKAATKSICYVSGHKWKKIRDIDAQQVEVQCTRCGFRTIEDTEVW